MKRFAKMLCVIVLSLIVLCACDGKTQEVTETRPPWNGYEGTSLHYVYYYESGRALKWEEDVIFLADNYLDDFGALTPYDICIETPEKTVYNNELYDPELREQFLAEINALIPKLEDMTDTQILFELQRIVAQLNDLHTYVVIPEEHYYPINFEILYADQKPLLYATILPEKYEEGILGYLYSVNDVPIDKVVAKLTPYISHENEQSLMHSVCQEVCNPDILHTIGILEDEDDPVKYTLISWDHRFVDVTLDPVTDKKIQWMDFEGYSLAEAYPFMYKDHNTKNFWYEYLPEDEMFYVRINQFEYMNGYGIMNLGNDILKETRELGGVHKLVIDLRYNPGGYQGYGYDQFITVLERVEADDIYVLINESTYSNGVITASLIKTAIPEAILVGTPAGQSPNFYGSVYDEDYIMPNCGVEFRLPQAYWRTMAGYEYDALMPDIAIYPTLQHYMYSTDYILEVVRNRP